MSDERSESGTRRDMAGPQRRSRSTRIRASLDRERGVFMISVAAELADMHPQTLRMYEAKGLISPKRSPKNTRLYSQDDVDRLRRIQEMTAEKGLNLAGVETVLELEERLEEMRAEMQRLRVRAEEMERRMAQELERAKRSLRAELVPYGAYESDWISPPPAGDGEEPEAKVRIPIERKRPRRR